MNRTLLAAVAVATIVATPGMAADLPVKGPVAKAPAALQFHDWTGFYLGAQVNYDWTRTDADNFNTASGAFLAASTTKTKALHGGGQIGYDHMFPSRVLIGIVADVTSGSEDTIVVSNAAGTNVHTAVGKVDVMGSVRGRLGYAFDNVLLYGTGGWAWTRGSYTRTQNVGTMGLATPGTVEQVDVNMNGWTVGAGLAWAFALNWNVFAEYRYTSYGSVTITTPIAQRSSVGSTATDTVALGFNYKF
jgi:opacity protein-like surface antigen